MASTKSRLVRHLSGARNEVDGIPSYATASDILVKDLTPRRIEGDYQANEFLTGQEGAQGDRLYNEAMGLDFGIEACGSGAAGSPPPYGMLLTACGLSEVLSPGVSAIYSPTAQGSVFGEAAFQYRDAQTSQVTEKARGTLSFSAETKRPPMFSFQFLGALFPGQASVVAVPDFSAWPDAKECSPRNMSAITLGGTELCVQSFSLSDGRTPTRGKFMNCGDTDIVGRNITGRLVVELPPHATKDLIELARSGATEPFVWQLGSEAGETIRVAAPNVQVKYGGEQNIDGELGLALDLVFIPDQGDDEVAFFFS